MTTDATETVAHEIEAEAEVHAGLPVHHGEKIHPSDWLYIKVALILGLLTAAEVSVSYMDIGKAFLPILLTLMVIKFVMVVLFFMHLKYDHAIFGTLFWCG